MSGEHFVTRRKFGALSLVGGSALILGGMSGCKEVIHEVHLEVDESDPDNPRIKPFSLDLNEKKKTKKIVFHAAPEWRFYVKNDDLPTSDGMLLGRAPRVWLHGKNPDDIATSPVSADGLTYETTTVPKKGETLHVYFVMARKPRVPGDCGGGGDIEGR